MIRNTPNRDSDLFELNLGGKVFTISPAVVSRSPFLQALRDCARPGEVTRAPFIDRCPHLFEVVLDCLRTGHLR